MAKVELKQPIVEEIANNIKDAQAVVLVDYSGLTVEQDTILRKELRESGVQYKVYKNTLMRRAFEGTPCADLDKHLHGTNAIAISATDATAPARILAKFAKQYPALELVAGIVEELQRSGRNPGTVPDPVQRRTSWQTAWKYPVSYYQLCSCA